MLNLVDHNICDIQMSFIDLDFFYEVKETSQKHSQTYSQRKGSDSPGSF